MEPITAEYAAKGIRSVFIYTREAHPGERFRHHRSLDDKIRHARAFRDRFDVKRPILVDDLVGTAHRAYGALPNMTYIVGGAPNREQDSAGVVVFKSEWTDPPTVRWTCEYLLLTQERRRNRERLVPFYAELAGYRLNDRRFTEAIRELAGEDAFQQMVDALNEWRTRPEGRPDSTIPSPARGRPGGSTAGQ